MRCFLDALGNFVHTNYCVLISYNEAPGEAVREVELSASTLRLLVSGFEYLTLGLERYAPLVRV